jgi:hypothetical protein
MTNLDERSADNRIATLSDIERELYVFRGGVFHRHFIAFMFTYFCLFTVWVAVSGGLFAGFAGLVAVIATAIASVMGPAFLWWLLNWLARRVSLAKDAHGDDAEARLDKLLCSYQPVHKVGLVELIANSARKNRIDPDDLDVFVRLEKHFKRPTNKPELFDHEAIRNIERPFAGQSHRRSLTFVTRYLA